MPLKHVPTLRSHASALLGTLLLGGTLLLASANSIAQQPPSEPPADWGPISSTMDEIAYPYPVHLLPVTHYGKSGNMAYMDVAPTGPANGQTAMLFHGMNFGGIGFTPTIAALAEAGFRVVVPDRIGYGKSSKMDIPYNLHILRWTPNACWIIITDCP